ncbi:MAG: hypothetical protein KatS3mg057_1363 [Herpetosiphonaceae bacterium]|nr:MAG: hypothetical protein KatS3mg057_1363 [Herpetosiphonaceae bacterium]
MKRRRIMVVVCLMIALAGLLPAARLSAQGDLNVWGVVVGASPSVAFSSVFMVDDQTAWAVGEDRGRGVAYRLDWRDGRWSVSFDQWFAHPLNEVVAISASEVWAVGDNGLIVHRDTSGWRSVEQPLPGATLTAIQMFGSGEEGWAGGFLPPLSGPDYPQVVLLHYQHGQWRQEPSVSGPGSIEELHFTGQVGWAAGDDVWRYEAGSWVQEPEPFACGENFPCPHTLNTVRAVSADEAWAVGSRHAICAACVTRPYVLHRTGGAWQLTTVPTGSDNPQSRAAVTGLSFNRDGVGLMVGWYDRGYDPVREAFDARIRPMVLRYQQQQWQLESLPIELGALSAVSMEDSSHALAVGRSGLILSYGYGAPPLPSAPVGRSDDPQALYVEPVGHTLRGVFRGYWERNGGLPVFGYPLTEEFTEINADAGHSYLVQYFERQRYEYHPELSGTPYEVLLGRLGVEVLEQQGRDWTSFPKGDPAAPHYFAETGHAIASEFWDYWRSHGLELGDPGVSFRESLALFGYPISEPAMETNSSGDTVLTQWFERARFEYHPDNPAPHKVLLGRLAAEVLRARGWVAQ